MPREITFLDALVPSLLLVFVLSLLLHWGLNQVLARAGFYRHVWHPPLFRLALFVCLFGSLGLLAMR